MGHKLPHFVSHLSAEGETQETQTPEFCSKQLQVLQHLLTHFNLRIGPARNRCQKLMENTAKPLIKITTLFKFPFKLDTTISHP